ncbi:MAG: helix-turn-helix domain-containing protein [Ruminiclostridium sp.]
MQIIGERLKTLRESMKLSQQKVADMIGCPQTSIHRYESGSYTPNAETLLWYGLRILLLKIWSDSYLMTRQ